MRPTAKTAPARARTIALPPIQSERLFIRPLAKKHSRLMQALTDDRTITAAVSFLPEPFTLAGAKSMIAVNEHGRDCFFGFWLRSEPYDLVGVAGAHLHGEAALEIGYWVGAVFRNKGYATEAMRALVAPLQQAFPHRRIIAECRPTNRASWRALEKSGFRPTGAVGRRPGRLELALLMPGGEARSRRS